MRVSQFVAHYALQVVLSQKVTRAPTALPFIRDFDPALRVAVSVSSRWIAIVLSGIITWSFPRFCIIYVHFGGASDPLAYNSAPLITLPEAGVGLVGVGLAS
ncbi:hypothetical protein MRX96_043670 [Rhipicephalus microplus]